MKHLTGKPSEGVMRFFTPTLYQQFNSPDDEEADRADEAWEEAIRAYQEHLSEVRVRMPSQVRKLADLCLHDAELLSRVEELQSITAYPDFPFPFPLPLWTAVAVLYVRSGDDLLSLIYCLSDRVRLYPPPEGWRFSAKRE